MMLVIGYLKYNVIGYLIYNVIELVYDISEIYNSIVLIEKLI